VQDGIFQDVRIALGAVAPVPLRVRAAEAALQGKPATEESLAEAGKLAAEAAKPISDIRGSAEYRLHLVNVLTQDCLRTAIAKGQA
jgi:carbon-monoxide dehydrogenase medium subunit